MFSPTSLELPARLTHQPIFLTARQGAVLTPSSREHETRVGKQIRAVPARGARAHARAGVRTAENQALYTANDTRV